MNTFVNKYLFDKDNSYTCLYESEVPSGTISGFISNPSTTTYANVWGSYTTSQSGGNLVYRSKYFAIYSSPYSGAFDLLDTMYIPRPCAAKSVNLTQMDYFYGQWAKSYDIRKESKDKVLVAMNPEQEFIFQNGTSSKLFAWLGNGNTTNSTTVYVQTNDESLVGTQRLIIRGCDYSNDLLEINYYINVSSNSAPEFSEDIQTQWNLNVNDKIAYKLPTFKDPELNDNGEVYINSMENQDFPAFVTFDNSTKTINMRPNSTAYQGRTYYFAVVLKEVHSDYMMNIYYMTIKMSGDPIDPDDIETPNKTSVSMSITYLNYHSEGTLQFSMGVNYSCFANIDDFNNVMKVYVNNTLKQREEIRSIELNIIDNKTINFTVRF